MRAVDIYKLLNDLSMGKRLMPSECETLYQYVLYLEQEKGLLRDHFNKDELAKSLRDEFMEQNKK